jgi:signal transduction histidine kinase/ActR/RegA family two-component response regulator
MRVNLAATMKIDVLPIAQLRLFVERMQAAALTLSRSGTILYCNAKFAALVKVEAQTLVGTAVQPFLGDWLADALQLGSDFQALPQGPRQDSIRAADGSSVPVSMCIEELPGDVHQPAVLCATFIDLSSNVQSAVQIGLDSAGMGSWHLSPASGLMARSVRHDPIFGYDGLQPSWSLQRTLRHCLEEDRAKVRAAFAQAEVTGGLDVEARIEAGKQGVRWVRFSARTYHEGDSPARIAGVIADVSERRCVEERFRQSQKIEALGQLAGGVAHDFNNLLQVISGGIQVVSKQCEPAQKERVVAAKRQAVERGARLCRQLLAFSSRQALKAEPLDLKALIERMRELLDHGLLSSVHMEYDFARGLWPVEVDAGELELVILNLAMNARDALPEGGVIRIAARNACDMQEHGLNGDFVRLDIQDDGVGMTPAVLAHAFEPFFTTKQVGRGSGLGLAQAHGFARASGGAIDITSAASKGTTASLFLPRSARTPSIMTHMEPDQNYEAEASGRVLRVEDDDQVAALTTEMIRQLGYDTTRVASAEAALGALERRGVDIVFSDVMMPGRMNGMQLAQEIRRRRPNLPVLLTSGYIEPSSRNVMSQPIKIIHKPYRMEQLRDALADVTRNARNSVREH